MLETEVDWRIHEHEKVHPPEGRRKRRRPSVPRPPPIEEIWHNGFDEQLGKLATDVRPILNLAASAQTYLANSEMLPREQYLGDLAFGEKQAIELAHRIGENQLDIPLNRHFNGKLAKTSKTKPDYALGNASITVIGPSQSELNKLRKQWAKWVEG